MKRLRTTRKMIAGAATGAALAALIAPMPDAGAAENWNYYNEYSGTTPNAWVVVDSLVRTHNTSGPMAWEQIDGGLPYNDWQCTTTTGGKASYTFGVFQTNLTDSKIVYSAHVSQENVSYTLSSYVPATVKWEGAIKLDSSCQSGHYVHVYGYAYY